MRIAVTGSIATDFLMTFPGKITDQLVADKLDSVYLSFLIDDLTVRRGGVAANIAFGLGSLGLRPMLVDAVGKDFAEYRSWLEQRGVDTDSVYVADDKHTARFLCTTDEMQNQIASFYAGAMSDARQIDICDVAERAGGLDMVLISAGDPQGMLRHARACRDHGYPFAADISQQLARMTPDEIRAMIPNATYLFTNEYEASLLLQKTGWTRDEVLGMVGSWITTLGSEGARCDAAGAEPVVVDSVSAKREVDPTGIGDAFRSGFFAGLSWGLEVEHAMQLGCTLATSVLEVEGAQEYEIVPDNFIRRVADTYGEQAASKVAPFLSAPK